MQAPRVALRPLLRRLSTRPPLPLDSSATPPTVAALNARMRGGLTTTLGFRVDGADLDGERAAVRASMAVMPAHLAPNGYCHAASVIALGDSACGAGAFMTLPDGVANFTTASVASSHVGTAVRGRLVCEAVALHLGRSTQVWDASVWAEGGDRVAVVRVTQILLQGRGKGKGEGGEVE